MLAVVGGEHVEGEDGPMSRVVTIVVLLATVLGLGFGFASGVLSGFAESWWVDVMLGVGMTLLLFVPLYYFGRILDRHIAEATAQIGRVQADADSLKDRVTHLQDSVDRRLEEVHAIVDQRLRDERNLDEGAFRALAITPSREALEDAMVRAEALRVVDPRHPPRVSVSESDYLYLQVARPTAEDQWASGQENLEFELVRIDGTCLASVPWPIDLSPEDVMVQVGRELRAQSREDFDSAAFFSSLSEILLLGLASPARCPVVQLVPPQWLITGRGLAVPYDALRGYSVSARSLRADPNLATHVKAKTWVDPDSFDEAAHALLELFAESPSTPPF